MRQASFLVVITLLIISFCSCQKELPDYSPGNTDSTASDTSSRVKRYVEDLYDTSASSQHVTDSSLLTYDSQGRLLTLTSITTSGSKLVFAYNGSQSYTMDLYTGNAISIHENFFVVNGRVDSTFQYNDEGDSSTEKYTYNSAKQVTRLYEYDYTAAGGSVLNNTTIYSYDANGDQNSLTDNSLTTRYTYTTNTVNNIDIGLNYNSVPKHLPDGETFIESGVSIKGTHTYTHDSRGRVTLDKLVLDDGTVSEKRYYY